MRIALLDIVANIPGAGELRARSYELLGIAPDAAMVDVGCGSGREVAEMAEVGIPEVLLPDFRDHVRRWAEPGSYGRVFVGPNGVPTGTQRVRRPPAATRAVTRSMCRTPDDLHRSVWHPQRDKPVWPP